MFDEFILADLSNFACDFFTNGTVIFLTLHSPDWRSISNYRVPVSSTMTEAPLFKPIEQIDEARLTYRLLLHRIDNVASETRSRSISYSSQIDETVLLPQP